MDPGGLPHQHPAEAGAEDREALGAATGCFSPGARGLAEFACFVAAVFVQKDTHRSGGARPAFYPHSSPLAESPGVQRAPKNLTLAVAAVALCSSEAQLKPCILRVLIGVLYMGLGNLQGLMGLDMDLNNLNRALG